ncbi:MAG: lactonase family protein [Planctomycetaceae bacterium]|nr:lactonase family protein [Planctomycetaceae bacterium]
MSFILCGVITSWCTLAVASGDESFHVVVPDAKSRCIRLFHVFAAGSQSAEQPRLSLDWPPSGIAVDHAGDRLVVTGMESGSPRAATVQLTDGRLMLQQESDLPAATGYTSVDRTGQFLLSASYRDGRADVYRLQQDGRVGPRTATFATPTKAAHAILTSRNNRFAYVPCVKDQNALYQFAFDASAGSLTPLNDFNARPPVMFGPRHYVYHPQLDVVYFSNEQQLGVSVFHMSDDGHLNALQHATTRPRRAPWQQGVRGLHASDVVMILTVNACTSRFAILFRTKIVSMCFA